LADNLVILSILFGVGFFLSDEQHVNNSWLFLLLILFYNYFADSQHVYRTWRGGSISEEVFSIIISWFAAQFFVLLINVLFVKDDSFSQFFWVACVLLVPAAVALVHLLVRLTLGFMRAKGINTRRVAIYGATPLGKNLADAFDEMPWSGFRFLGFFDDRKEFDEERRSELDLLGGAKDLFQACRTGEVERVYITLSMAAEVRTKYIIEELADTTVSVYVVPDMFTFDLLQSKIEDYRGIPAVSIYDTPFSGVDSFIKRVEDIVLSVVILFLISIPMLIIAIGVKRSSPGPVFFKQNRYGRGGEKIVVWKFRSMTVMENSDKVIQATKNDVRITPFGAFIRRTSLDELPQFINVLQGTMSIVGPRPHAISHNEEYRKLIPGYMLRHKIKPGITGLAQVKGFRGETETLDKMKKRVHFDLAYIRKWSVFLDLKIVFLTIFNGFVHKNAY
jgi:putative colanic acid biosynthesis UDP-glucose lipid carrier transferase